MLPQTAARAHAQELLQKHPSMAGRLPTTRLGFFWYWLTRFVGACWFELRWRVRQVRRQAALHGWCAAACPVCMHPACSVQPTAEETSDP